MKNLGNFAILMFLILAATSSASTQGLFSGDSYNGFDVSRSLIPKDEFVGGGPPKDGIPAILEPKFETAKSATWLKDDDLVAGVNYRGVQKAYPLRILVWHEAANDEVGGIRLDLIPSFFTRFPLKA